MAKIVVNGPPLPPFRINNFAGVNKAVTPTQIRDNESPEMFNIQLDEVGAMDKRPGYSRIFTTSLGAGKINGLHRFKKTDGTKIFLIHHGTKLYTQANSAQPVQIYVGMANERSRSFLFGNKLYIIDGTNYLVYDGVTVVDVSTVAYVPTLHVAGGASLEQFNLLTPLFKESFSGDGTNKDFTLSISNLDVTPLIAWVGGVPKAETTDFTVNRTTGKVTFIAAPPLGVANNVLIQASKTVAGKANQIKNCRFFVIYGGTNDTRVFLAGNPNFVNWLWRTGVSDPTYWPENTFQKVGGDSTAITGFAKQYTSCLVLKEPSPNETVVWNMNYQLGSDGITVTFPIIPLNEEIGCSSPDSVQLVENMPVFYNAQKGVNVIASTTIKDERNARGISDYINPSMLKSIEQDVKNAVSVDFENKYILVIGSTAYVCNYTQKYVTTNGDVIYPWIPWTNIPASCFLEMDGALYFGSNAEGLVFRFNAGRDADGETIATSFNDNGAAIHGYWESKVFSFNDDEHLKMVEKMFFSLKPSSATSADFYYVTDRADKTYITTARNDTFDFNTLNFSHLSFVLSSLPQEIARKIKAKKIIYFQVIIENNVANESLGILSIGIKLHTQREVK